MSPHGSVSINAVVVEAIAHHRLVSIHPVSDGNGRLARAGQILKPLVSAGFVEVIGKQRSARYRLAK